MLQSPVNPEQRAQLSATQQKKKHAHVKTGGWLKNHWLQGKLQIMSETSRRLGHVGNGSSENFEKIIRDHLFFLRRRGLVVLGFFLD